MLSQKIFSDFGRNLVIRHLIHGFNLDNALLKPLSFQPFHKFAFGFTRAKSLYRSCLTNVSDDVIKVFSQILFKSFVSNSLCFL